MSRFWGPSDDPYGHFAEQKQNEGRFAISRASPCSFQVGAKPLRSASFPSIRSDKRLTLTDSRGIFTGMGQSVAAACHRSRKKILLVDDHLAWTTVLREVITHVDPGRFEVDAANSGAEGMAYMQKNTYDLVFLDLNMGDSNGIDILRDARAANLARRYVLMSAEDKVRNAVEALRLGASDFLVKPFGRAQVMGVLERLYPNDQKVSENENAQLEWRNNYAAGIIGEHPALMEVLLIIERIAGTNATVLITGEPGTGKELVARAVHRASPRRDGSFLPLNVTATSDSLFESTLFGWVKGAFTGGNTDRAGFFEEANEGSIFLDEIGELPLMLQPKLLRVLQTGSFNRIGEVKERHSTARVIAATNRNLAQLVSEGKFREDLFWRLNVIPIRLPPLRERASDIPILAEHFLAEGARKSGSPVMELSDEVKEWMMQQPWKGNIRQLEHTIRRICLLHRDSRFLRLEDVMPYASHDPMQQQLPASNPAAPVPSPPPAAAVPTYPSPGPTAPMSSSATPMTGDFAANGLNSTSASEGQPQDLAKPEAAYSPHSSIPKDEEDLLARIALPIQGIQMRRLQQQIEAKLICEAMRHKNFVRAHAAKMLGIRRTTLVEKIRKLSKDYPELLRESGDES